MPGISDSAIRNLQYAMDGLHAAFVSPSSVPDFTSAFFLASFASLREASRFPFSLAKTPRAPRSSSPPACDLLDGSRLWNNPVHADGVIIPSK